MRQRLDVLNVANTSVHYRPHETVFAQGDRCATVMYIQTGRVKLSVTSPGGRNAVVAVLRAGAFFGEGALAGQQRRRATAERRPECHLPRRWRPGTSISASTDSASSVRGGP